MKIHKRRDLTIIFPTPDAGFVLACDSCGGIGEKEGDVFHTPPFYVGKWTCRVVLLELICFGAIPLVVANGVCNEMDNTGKEIIRGIQGELAVAGYPQVAITGSTEENFPTGMTGIGLTAFGWVEKKAMRMFPGEKGDAVIVVGQPQVGGQVNLEDDTCYQNMASLLAMPEIKEIVPVGSQGIKYEAATMAGLHGLTFVEDANNTLPLNVSGGPACCQVCLCGTAALSKIDIPYTCIGYVQ